MAGAGTAGVATGGASGGGAGGRAGAPDRGGRAGTGGAVTGGASGESGAPAGGQAGEPGECVTIPNAVTIDEGAAVEKLRGVCEITGTLFIRGVVEDLSPLERLVRVGGLVVSSETLVSLDGLNALSDVGGGVYLTDNPELANIDALGNVTTARQLSVRNNPRPLRLEAFRKLKRLESFELVELPWLENLDAFSGLTHVGHITLQQNESLASIAGLGGVRCDRAITIMGTAITNVDALHAVTLLDQSLTIADNPELASLDGLRNLTSVRSIAIMNNDSLANLDAFSALADVSSLRIGNNNALANVDGLSALTTVDAGGLIVQANLVLGNLRGFAALGHIARALEVTYNPALPACEAEWLRDHVGLENIGGPVTLHENLGTGTCPP
jgi:hypothetical protein